MTKFYAAKIQTNDAKAKGERRFRNIVAASGKILEDGEIRDIERLYVMGRDGKLIKVSDLAKDPEKQTQTYKVNFAENHGHYDPVTGERVVEVEDVLGDAKVWLDTDGVHARVYFANDDPKADHAWAISDNASYSTGIEWYPDGYYGADNDIDEPIGVLREISIVPTGNDPRARTIDTKSSKVAIGDAVGDSKTNFKKGIKMPGTKKSIDALTPDERAAMQREMGEAVDSIIDKFTTSAPESETEPTARDTKDEVNDAEEAKKKEEAPLKDNTKDTYHMPVLVINDRKGVARQEFDGKKTQDWLTSNAGHRAFAKCLKQAGKLGATFDGLWRQELSKHISLDDISGLPTPTNIVSMFRDALEKPDGIISHVEVVNAKGLKINLISAVAGNEDLARAHGHKKGDIKVDQELENTTREILCKMVYKRLPLDAMELWENPELIDFRARELVDAIILEIERAIVIGDGRTAPTGNNPDYRLWDGVSRGFISIKSDAAATTGLGTFTASTYTQVAGDNAYDTIIKARALIKKEGRQFIVAKNSWVATALTARLGANSTGDYLVQPGTKIEDLLGVERVYTPQWMENDSNDAYLIVEKAYKMVGQTRINTHADFDTSKNENILLDETPRGGALGEYKSAVAIAPAATASALSAQAGDAPATTAKTSTRSAKTAAAKTPTKAADTTAENKNDEQTK